MLGIIATLIVGYMLLCIGDALYYIMGDIESPINHVNILLGIIAIMELKNRR